MLGAIHRGANDGPEQIEGRQAMTSSVAGSITEHAEPGSVGGAADAMSQVVGFRLADEEYGVDIMRVQEIILVGQITSMPEVPDFICGLINLRGNVIPIVDLRKRFGLRITENNEQTRIVVINVGERTVGIVVDEVNEVLRINPDQIEPAPASVSGVNHTFIRGLVKLDGKLLILLNIEDILAQDEQATLTGGDECATAR